MKQDQVCKKNILIVEDDPVTAFITENILESHFNTDTVQNGHDALTAVEKKEYDLVLMDINLGDLRMDGIHTMRLMRNNEKRRKLKIVAVTVISDERSWYIGQGFDELIMKPINLDYVLHTFKE